MDLKNGYKVIYEKIADGTRTFYATKNAKCDPTLDDKIIEAEIGKYKLIYEKDGCVYCSESGVPAESDTCFEDFNKVFIKDDVAVNVPSHAPIKPEQPSYTEAIATNGDSYGTLYVENSVVTLKATGTVGWKKSAWGTYGNWIGFKINVPEGVDAATAIYTRPNGKSSLLSEVLDPGKNYASVYSDMSKFGETATYYLDWNGDGENDLTIIIDTSEAVLEAAPENTEEE